MTSFLGYKVTKNTEDTGLAHSVAYILTGPRGAEYHLMRTHKNPAAMYAFNARRFNIVSLKGNAWFTDKDGELTVW